MPAHPPHPRSLITHTVSPAEHNTIVAALRFWQDTVLTAGISMSTNGWILSDPLPTGYDIEKAAEQAVEVAVQDGYALDREDVDWLCTRLRT